MSTNEGNEISVFPRLDVADQRFIEIPLVGRYEFNDKKLSYYLEFGFSSHVYLSSKFRITTHIGSLIEYEDDTLIGGKRLLLALVIGGRVNYNITSNIQLFVQPSNTFLYC